MADKQRVVETLPLRQIEAVRESVLRDSHAIEALYRFTGRIQSASTAEEVCRIGAEAVLEVFPKASHALILRHDPTGNTCLPAATRGRAGQEPGQPAPANPSILRRVIEAEESVLFEAGAEEVRDSRSLARARVRSCVCCPLWHGGRIGGVLQAGCREDAGPFDRRDLEILTLAGSQLAVRLQDLELADRLVEAEERFRVENEELQNRIQEQTRQLDRAHTELENTQVKLVHAEKMASLGALVAGVAHELNNPISFIYDNLGFLEKYTQTLLQVIEHYETATLEEQDRKRLDRIRKELNLEFVLSDIGKLQENFREGAERTRRIVTDLRTFSRLDEADRKVVDLHEGLESTLALLTNKLKNSVRVHRRYGDLPQVECYPGQLNQVFVNLLTNAADAVAGEGDLWITTSYHDGEDCVRVRIEDSGRGIPEEDIPKLFDPFFTTKEVGKGTGLGLSVSYGIVQRHGGRIEVESRVGKGSAFTVVLPVRLRHDEGNR